MTEKQTKFLLVIVGVLSLSVIIGTILHYLVDLMLRVAILEAKVEILERELEEEDTRELEPFDMRRGEGGDYL